MQLLTLVGDEFKKTLADLTAAKIPVTVAWKLRKIRMKIDEHLSTYEQARLDLVKKYATKNENGDLAQDEKGLISVDKENIQAYSEDLMQLLKVEVEVPTLSIKELGDKLEIEADKLLSLGDILVD